MGELNLLKPAILFYFCNQNFVSRLFAGQVLVWACIKIQKSKFSQSKIGLVKSKAIPLISLKLLFWMRVVISKCLNWLSGLIELCLHKCYKHGMLQRNMPFWGCPGHAPLRKFDILNSLEMWLGGTFENLFLARHWC